MVTSPEFSVVIPARYASTRLPGKPLLDIGGKPMIRHVWERAIDSGATRTIVATDDARIEAACLAFGAQVEMTDAGHASGTERIAEVIRRLGLADDAIVVNVQGDEPLLPSSLILQVAENLAASEPAADVATLCEPIDDAERVFDPDIVKVIKDQRGFALYFSRAPVPWDRQRFSPAAGITGAAPDHLRHIGIYAYRAGYLGTYVSLPPPRLENLERLEQLRILYHGGRIHVARALERPGPGVDTPKDLERVRQLVEDLR
ncbi:MAG: 3-deoxy-manno-octulosonate cytidylyltransferase [Gammaproteobacteria bacterium]|nr:3-deoxy-manno-octulosonate cytidylyltransferase [Gammaproteobacteria bacterium]